MSLVEQWRRLSVHPMMKTITGFRIHAQWVIAGRPIPAPPMVKQRLLRGYQRRYGLRTLVETGTFTGETVEALRGHFSQVISIELAPALHAAAARRFAAVNNVRLLQGDSPTLLPDVLDSLEGPALFWLDGHYAGGDTAGLGESPLMKELRVLLARPPRGDVILIDDARDLSGTAGYPSLEEVCATIRAARPNAEVGVADDVIRWIDRLGTP
jgi:hypothetical protein